MSSIQSKITRHAKIQENTWSEETKIASESDADMAEILKLLDWEFKMSKINMINALSESKENARNTKNNVEWRKLLMR